MMNAQWMPVVLIVLVALVALNLLLTLRLATIIQARENERLPMGLPTGGPLPEFTARRFSDGARVTSHSLRGQAAVLVFLSPGCGDCQTRRGELSEMRASIAAAGVALWVFCTNKDRDAREYLAGTPLIHDAMALDRGGYRKLNPRNAAPFYLFVDDAGTVIATNFIGDADWLSFCEQMREGDSE